MGSYPASDSDGANYWADGVDTVVGDDERVVEGTWYGTSDVAMVVLLTDKSVQVDSMSIDSRKLEQKLHEHLFHFYHSSCWRNSFSWNHLFHRREGGGC